MFSTALFQAVCPRSHELIRSVSGERASRSQTNKFVTTRARWPGARGILLT